MHSPKPAATRRRATWLRRSVALPSDHGSWVFVLMPLLVGVAVGRTWSAATAALAIAVLAGFLVRQPITLAVKALVGRRSRGELKVALLWSAVHALVGALAVLALVRLGFGWILVLAAPGAAIFVWYLTLVARRHERRALLLELLATGVLPLAAPAGLWVGQGRAVPIGWLLWLLMWAQSAVSIGYVYVRLEQRRWPESRTVADRLRAAAPALAPTALFVAGTLALGLRGVLPPWLFLAPVVQLVESGTGTLRPATGATPSSIGKRQLAVSTLFTVVFLVTWNL